MNRLILNKLNTKRNCGTAVSLITELSSGKQTLVDELGNQLGDSLPSNVIIDAKRFLLADKNSKIE